MVQGDNILTPGSSEEKQARFITFVAALARAVHLHGDVIRTGVATAGNDHRLGAQEAPPAIISLYTGDLMMRHIESIMAGGDLAGYGSEQTDIEFGTTKIQPVTVRSLRSQQQTFPMSLSQMICASVTKNLGQLRGSQQDCALPILRQQV